MFIGLAKELAHGLNNKLRLGLTPRPWNKYQPASTFYWLVPSGEWPAYQYGKFVFSSLADYPRKQLLGMNDVLLGGDEIFVGFHIEKGFGDVARVVDSKLVQKGQIMDAGWAWCTLVQPDEAEGFGRTLSRVSDTEEMHLYVESSYVHDRESSLQPQYDAIVFSCQSGDIRAILNNRFPVGVLSGMDQLTDFGELLDRLRTIDDYHWVDIYIGTYVSTGEVDLKELYAGVLSYFEPWVVA